MEEIADSFNSSPWLEPASPDDPSLSGSALPDLSSYLSFDDMMEVDDENSTEIHGDDNSDIVNSVLRVLQAIHDEGLTLGRFLWAFSWGDKACVSHPVVKNTRTAFMKSRELPDILRNWRLPPRSSKSHKSRTDAGRNPLETFAVEAVENMLHTEMDLIDPLLRASEDRLTKDDLTSLDISDLEARIQELAPTLWSLFNNLCMSTKERKQGISKDLGKLCNRFQWMLAVYFKFKGLTAKGGDTLHALGLAMSSKWTTNAVEAMSAEAMAEVKNLIKCCASFFSYDNVYVTFHIYSQRLDKSQDQSAGTAATVYVNKNIAQLPVSVMKELQSSWRTGMVNPITSEDIIYLQQKSALPIHDAEVFHVLQVLIDSPDFSLSTYEHRDSSLLSPPPPVTELPCGPGYRTLQYMLGSLPIPEATYEDNDKVISELLDQLGYKSQEMRHQMARERIQFVVGDQLTVERIRGLQQLLCQELNSYERLDYIIPVFGWLHFQMAFAKSLHKQYFGTDAGKGLKHAFAVLVRKGLERRVTQGPFHDNLEHALYDILEAHLRACWLSVAGVDQLKDLRKYTPSQLRGFAEHVVRDYASSNAMVHLKRSHPADTVRWQTMMFLRNTLLYVVLDRAIKHGDVGMMEGVLPHALVRFAGGQNSKYTVECLELLQGLHREWPPDVR
ncbi:hypothetical protein C8Q80DRAFT_1344137 [Daedaleopsis nitida]|nr:hypothetical protein C8Q80DRAFT_1344137 [Daedaleopsis nitida]